MGLSLDCMWKAHGSEGTWRREDWQLQVDRAQPELGVTVSAGDAGPLERCRFTALTLSELDRPVVEESLIRGHDLISRYSMGTRDRIEPHVYWRVTEPLGFAWQTLVSVKTDRLDGYPRMKSVTHLLDGDLWLPANRKFRWEQISVPTICSPISSHPPVYVFRFRDRDYSYVEMVYPTDFRQARFSRTGVDGDGWNCEFQLFHESLEKGVIRLCRVQSAFVPRADDMQRAEAIYRDFLNESPPLTT